LKGAKPIGGVTEVPLGKVKVAVKGAWIVEA
jgi:hypothetical protein